MALYIGEEEVWKCPKHPSKRRRNGICPTCLRDRLGTLCPNCATLRPCECSATASTSSSRRTTAPVDPKLWRSRSVALPFMGSRRGDFSGDGKIKATSFWGSFRSNKSRKGEKDESKEELAKDLDEENEHYSSKIGEFEKMMMKSRSMRVPITSEIGGGDVVGSVMGKFHPSEPH
ncbi:hypothetical protein Leryth_005450 [Lithospermum erythrorhizon]|nr:hypothetical protein Leryth_005450 [Lithospermum erythrorhizon]